MLEEYKNVLTTEELAEILRLNEKTVIKMIKEGKLPAMKIASQFRFTKEKVIEWMETQMGTYSNGILRNMEKGLFSKSIQVHKILSRSCVKLKLSAGNRDDALREVVALSEKSHMVKDAGELLRLVLQREQLHSTGVGKGLAFPHPRSVSRDAISGSLLAIGTSRKGIDFAAADPNPVRIIVLFATPYLQMHLQILSRLTRIFSDSKVRNGVLRASTPAQVIAMVRTKERALG